MREQVPIHGGWFSKGFARCGLILLGAGLCLFTSGCVGPVSKHATALASATAPVIEQAAAAYRAANTIHEQRVDYDAVLTFENDHSIDPLRAMHPLISDEDLELRLKMLTAFQLYVKTLVEIANGVESPELDAASTSLGGNVAAVGNTVGPTVENALGIAAPSPPATTATPATPISQDGQNALTTGINALGQFLAQRAISKDLPKLIIQLDPKVIATCKQMISEIDSIRDAEKIDFDYLLSSQKTLVMNPAIQMSEVERRNEIAKMQRLVREQHAADLELTGLRTALVQLALTHHALAAEVAGSNPESLKEKLKELIAAGKRLGTFYQSLPTS